MSHQGLDAVVATASGPWVVELVMEGPRISEAKEGQIPLDLCRQLLAGEAHGLSDEEVELIRRHADAFAHVLLEIVEDQTQA